MLTSDPRLCPGESVGLPRTPERAGEGQEPSRQAGPQGSGPEMLELACLHLELELQKQLLVLLSVLMGLGEDCREGTQ